MSPPKKRKMSENEKQIFESITKGNEEEVKRLLGEKDVIVDCLDEHGMTPLQHSAYKGNKSMCELLLTHGADVNCNEHEYSYTALMFAGLSGNVEVVRLMLAAGARTSSVNSVGRTASQMAAFVGQHHCVSVINNYFSREDLDYYTVPHGLETEPKLPLFLAPSLHKLILNNNLNPIKILMFLEQNPELIEHALKVSKLLETLCEKQIKQSETNDIMSFKMHYLAYIVRSCHKHLEDKKSQLAPKTVTLLDSFKKVLIKGREKDGFPVNMEIFLRQGIREFPYHECALLQQIVRNLAPVKMGESLTALSILTSAINGQHAASQDEAGPCTTCSEPKAQRCSACKMVSYCNSACQKLDWPTHKRYCKKLATKYKKQQEMLAERQAEKEKEEEEKAAREAAEKEKAENEIHKEDQVANDVNKDSEVDLLSGDHSVTITELDEDYKDSKDFKQERQCDGRGDELLKPLDTESIKIEC